MNNIKKILTEKPSYLNGIIFLLVLIITLVMYWECRDNYFFSDDFEWLARGILAQDITTAPAEITRIEGRDFNPVFIIILTLMIRLFGLSQLWFRVLSLLTFAFTIFMFYYILNRYFNVNRMAGFSAALLCGFNVFVSEVVLNISALVYTSALLLFFLGFKFLLDGKRTFYFIFLLLAFLTKETIILAAIPLLFYSAGKKHRVFVIITGAGLILSRVLLQWFTAVPGKYTSLVEVSGFFFYKLYFIMLRTLGISPYALNPILGIAILIFLILSGGYFAFFKRNRSFLFFFLFFTLFALFFSLLPKLTSRYFFYPAFGFWGMAALWFHYFYEKNKKVKYALCLLPVILFFNYMLIKKEIVDYKILGEFSQQFIQQQASIIKSNFKTGEFMIYKTNFQPLADVYKQIKDRGNIKKLLPFREHGLGGVIEPAHLVPITFYPQRIIRWYFIKETPGYFAGELKVLSP